MASQPQQIKTEIVINARPDKIWNILMDFENYPKWNPFIRSIKGKPETGVQIKVRLEPPDARGMTIKPRVLEVADKRRFRWQGHLVIPGLFDGEHIFELMDNKNGSTTFIHREYFRGVLVPLFRKMLDDNTRRGFEMMNRQLKIESEKQHAEKMLR
jgi:hypothetical protein